jgi:methanogenic corrinoid protein MtbC1
MHYNMSSFCTLAGINEHTLRAWERRYAVISPSRSNSNRRLYSEDDLEKVRLLVRLVDAGHAISRIGPMSLSELKNYLTKLDDVTFENTTSNVCSSPDISRTTPAVFAEHSTACFAAVQEGSTPGVAHSLRRARTHLTLEVFLKDFISSLMHRVGSAVFLGELHIWQEHVFTVALRNELAIAEMDIRMSRTLGAQQSQKVFLFATIEGNHHEIGSLVASLLALNAGFESHYLGPHLPASEFALAMQRLNATHAVLGAKEIPPGEEVLDVVSYVKNLKKELRKKQFIWVGGQFAPEKHASLENLPSVKVFTSLAQFHAAL